MLSCRAESSYAPGDTQDAAVPSSSSLKVVYWSEIKAAILSTLSTDTGPMTETRKEQSGAAPADGARGIFLSCTRLYAFKKMEL